MLTCACQKKVVTEVIHVSDFYCSNQSNDNVNRYSPNYYVQIVQMIKDSDTLTTDKLMCLDSVRFDRAFIDITDYEPCLEMGIEGSTYFTAKTNKEGRFEEVQVVRSADECFNWVVEKIRRKVLTLQVTPEDAGTYEILFVYRFRFR
jgi:hypothetical protein